MVSELIRLIVVLTFLLGLSLEYCTHGEAVASYSTVWAE